MEIKLTADEARKNAKMAVTIKHSMAVDAEREKIYSSITKACGDGLFETWSEVKFSENFSHLMENGFALKKSTGKYIYNISWEVEVERSIETPESGEEELLV